MMIRAVLLASALAACAPGAFAQAMTRSEKQEFDRLKTTVRELAAERREILLADEVPDAVPQAPDPRQVRAPATGSVMERTRRFVAAFYASTNAYDMALAKRMGDLIGGGLLAPAALTSDTGLAESAAKVDELEALFDGVERAQPGFVAHFTRELEGIWAGQQGGKAFMDGIRIGVDRRMPSMQKLFALRRDTIATFRAVLDYARTHRPTLEDDTLVFETDEQIAGYNALVDRLDALGKREEAVIAEMAASLAAISSGEAMK